MNRLVALAGLLCGVPLVLPGVLQAQADPLASAEWQLLVPDASWAEVERLEAHIRSYQEEGAIGHFEIRLAQNGERYDALVVAVVVDAWKLARLRNLDLPDRSRAREPEVPPSLSDGPPADLPESPTTTRLTRPKPSI